MRMKKNTSTRYKVGYKAGAMGIITNLLLSAGKIGAGYLSHSQALIGDGINSLSDALSSFITVLGFYMSSKPADKEHPYGHQRSEYIAGFVMTLIMAYLGIEIVRSSFNRIVSPISLSISILTILVMIVSIIIKVIMVIYYRKKGNEIESEVLIAASQDSKNDVYMTSALLLAIIIQFATNLNIDGYIGVFIGIYIIYSSAQMIRDFIDELMGTRPKEELLEKIQEILDEEPEIIGYHDCMVHFYGKEYAFGTVHIELNQKMSLVEAHTIIDNIERKLYEMTSIEMVAHLDPLDIDGKELKEIYHFIKKFLKINYPETSFHDLRVIDNRLCFDLVLNGSKDYDKIEAYINEYLVSNNIQLTLEITKDNQQLI